MIQPPPLKNDCFAMPPGVDWTPVDVALSHLQAIAAPTTPVETRPLWEASGRFLAEPVLAARAHPPNANSAVDGYAFAHVDQTEDVTVLPLAEGRAAAGVPFRGEVPQHHALRILTGAIIPDGVDTVVLEEDVAQDGQQIAFRGPLKRGANTRTAGEDVRRNDPVATAERKLLPQDLGLLAAVGVQDVRVRAQLRVGVLSTGDEIVERDARFGQIYDANRPMLCALAQSWGYRAIDLGHAEDDAGAVQARLDAAVGKVDVILTSGGASAGDEDHLASVLRRSGSLGLWRIAIKPGRPLALGMWNGIPVFGLPGNPVAAFVCTLVFAAPVFRVLAGGPWTQPVGYMLPAAFEKSKKPGRREFLRARLNPNGAVDVFKSEGSGRISGLTWADGLVELPDEACVVAPGDSVRYIPYSGF